MKIDIFKIYDLVRISKEISHDTGYSDQLGIIEKERGVPNSYYVMAYNKQNKRYWICGIESKYLTKIENKDDYYLEYSVLLDELNRENGISKKKESNEVIKVWDLKEDVEYINIQDGLKYKVSDKELCCNSQVGFWVYQDKSYKWFQEAEFKEIKSKVQEAIDTLLATGNFSVVIDSDGTHIHIENSR